MFAFKTQRETVLNCMILEFVKCAQNSWCDPCARNTDWLPQYPQVAFYDITQVRLTCQQLARLNANKKGGAELFCTAFVHCKGNKLSIY
jgi:hypothetical protein